MVVDGNATPRGRSLVTRQLPLGIELDVAATFESFLPHGNDALIAALRAIEPGRPATPVWICGPAGSGKSHLLQATCSTVSARGGRAMYVPLARVIEFEPGILDGLEGLDLLALDDVDGVAGRADWEAALFAAVNAFFLSGAPLITAAKRAPRDVAFALADLQSRASAHALYRLQSLDDAQLQTLVLQRAAAKGLAMDAAAAAYLLRRVRRDMHTLDEWLNRLDRASLAEKRRVSVALVRSLMSSIDGESG